MVAFLIRRFFGLIFVMFAVTFLTFMIGHAAPGDPIRTILGFRYDPATYRRLVHFYGLDRPLLVQFGDYLWHIVRYADFGHSYRFESRPVVGILREDFIRTARSKGLPRSRIVALHALRPALLPVITYLGPAVAGLITGTFVVENIFNLPGIGFTAVTSIEARDYPVVEGATIIAAFLVVMMNLLADILYRVLDPRITE